MGAGVMKPGSGGRHRRRGRRGKPQVMSEINVTPFVDVMLVLLIIFMVAAPLLTVGVPLELPRTAAQAVGSQQEEPLAISLQADGTIAIQNSPVPETELVPKLRAVLAERSDDRVFLRADGKLAYARVAEVMGALNSAGISNIVLVTESGGPRLDGSAGN